MTAHVFLSAAWILAAREIHDDFKGRIVEPDEPLRLNVTVVDAPFDEGHVIGHVDTTTGSVVPQEGHLGDPDVSIRVPYIVARLLLVEQQYESLMISFMSGDIEVEGDITRLFSLQDFTTTPEQQQLADEVVIRLRGITA